jgi:hypothetical protein
MISTVFDLCTVLTFQRVLLCPRYTTKYWYKRWHATPHLQLSGHATLHLPVYFVSLSIAGIVLPSCPVLMLLVVIARVMYLHKILCGKTATSAQ